MCLIPTSPADAIATPQPADDTSLNAAAGSTDAQNGYIANVGCQQSFADANGGHIDPLYDTYSRNREAELALSGSVFKNSMQLETDICSHDEALHLTNTDRVNNLQTEVSVEHGTDKITSDGKYPESSVQVGSDYECHALGASEGNDAGIEQDMNISRERGENSCLEIEFVTATNDDCDQGKSSEDGKTCVVGPASFIVHDLTASIPENNSSLLALHEKSGNDLEESDASLPSNSASKMESVSNIVDTDDVSTLNGSLSQSSKLHMIDALENIIVDARNNKVFVVCIDHILFSAISQRI